MGFATHLGPWLLGTVKEGPARNTGCTIVAQVDNLTAAQIAGLTGNLGYLPAGAAVTSVQFLTTTLFASATTLKLTIAGVDVNTASTITAAGTIVVTNSATFTPIAANVGATDAAITFTATGTSLTGAVTIVIGYIMRNSDGSTAPVSA